MNTPPNMADCHLHQWAFQPLIEKAFAVRGPDPSWWIWHVSALKKSMVNKHLFFFLKNHTDQVYQHYFQANTSKEAILQSNMAVAVAVAVAVAEAAGTGAVAVGVVVVVVGGGGRGRGSGGWWVVVVVDVDVDVDVASHRHTACCIQFGGSGDPSSNRRNRHASCHTPQTAHLITHTVCPRPHIAQAHCMLHTI